MKRIKLIYKELVGLFVCLVVSFLDINSSFIGETYNYFFPCKYSGDVPLTSAPCYLGIDLLCLGLLIVLGLFLLVRILIKIFRKVKE